MELSAVPTGIPAASGYRRSATAPSENSSVRRGSTFAKVLSFSSASAAGVTAHNHREGATEARRTTAVAADLVEGRPDGWYVVAPRRQNGSRVR